MEILDTKYFVIFVILIWLNQANARDCYVCNFVEEKCNDPFKKTGVSTVPCAGSCFKAQSKHSNENLNAPAAARGCAPILSTGNDCIESTADGNTGTVCMCNENLCNYAFPMGSSAILMTAAIVMYIAVH